MSSRRATALIAAVIAGLSSVCSREDDGVGAGDAQAGQAGTMPAGNGGQPAGGPQGGRPRDGGLAGADAAAPAEPDAAVLAMPDAARKPTVADSRHAYVYVAGGSEVRSYRLDLATGKLTETGKNGVGRSLSYGTIAPDGAALYVCENIAGSAILAYAIDPNTGVLRSIGQQVVNPQRAIHCAVDPTGAFIVSSHFDGNTITATPLLAGGKLGPPVSTQPSCAAPHQVAFDPKGGRLLIPCRDSAAIFAYDLNPGTGAIGRVEARGATGPGGVRAGPRHLVFTPDRRWVFLLSEGGDLTSYPHDVVTGALGRGASQGRIAGGASHIEVTPDGRFVYAATRSDSQGSAVHAFAVDGATGALGGVQKVDDASITVPRDFAMDPTGGFLVVASQTRSTLVVLAIDRTTGRLTRGMEVPTVGGPQWVGATVVRAP